MQALPRSCMGANPILQWCSIYILQNCIGIATDANNPSTDRTLLSQQSDNSGFRLSSVRSHTHTHTPPHPPCARRVPSSSFHLVIYCSCLKLSNQHQWMFHFMTIKISNGSRRTKKDRLKSLGTHW